MQDQQTTHHLAVLRGALDALHGLGDDAPDPERLRATLQALDPALAFGAFGPPAWVLSTGLPSPRWLAEVTARREQLLLEQAEEPPDDKIVRATALDPDLAQRLITERTFRRFLRRHPTFPAPAPAVRTFPDGPWWTWDAVLDDGRWGRIRVRGDDELREPATHDWFELDFQELEAEVGYEDVRRCVIGPAWRDAAGVVVGVLAAREATAEAAVTRLALERMCAEDVGADGVVVIPFALPTGT